MVLGLVALVISILFKIIPHSNESLDFLFGILLGIAVAFLYFGIMQKIKAKKAKRN